jgi:hypothetical protein
MANFSIYIYIYTHSYIYAAVSNGKQKTDAQVIFIDPFTIFALCKQKFVVCPFVDEETNGSYQMD